jgi:hypothetical protein
MLTPVLYGSNRFFAHTKSIRVYTVQEQKETYRPIISQYF